MGETNAPPELFEESMTKPVDDVASGSPPPEEFPPPEADGEELAPPKEERGGISEKKGVGS